MIFLGIQDGFTVLARSVGMVGEPSQGDKKYSEVEFAFEPPNKVRQANSVFFWVLGGDFCNKLL